MIMKKLHTPSEGATLATTPVTIFADIPADLTDDQRTELLLAMRARLAEVYVGPCSEPMAVEVHDFEDADQ